MTDLVPARSIGGRGRGRLDDRVEVIIAEMVRKRFWTRQKRSISVIHREIRQTCLSRGLPAQARNTVGARIAGLHQAQVARRQGGPDAARPLQSAGCRCGRVGIWSGVPAQDVAISAMVNWRTSHIPAGLCRSAPGSSWDCGRRPL